MSKRYVSKDDVLWEVGKYLDAIGTPDERVALARLVMAGKARREQERHQAKLDAAYLERALAETARRTGRAR